MRSFEQIPRDLLLDSRVSVGARLLYPTLRYLAWRNGRRSDADAVELPTLAEIAGTLGVAESTVKGYLGELRACGWIETRRAARNRPTLYVIHDAPREPEIGPPESRKSADEGGPSLLALDGDRRTAPTERSSDVPKLVLVDGQNLALNALLRVCKIDPRSNRVREAAAALATGGPNLDRGIRELYYLDEVRDGYEHRPNRDEQDEPFERRLAAEIVRRGEVYRREMPGASLTPFALAKWWTDVERGEPRDAATRAADEAVRLAEEGR